MRTTQIPLTHATLGHPHIVDSAIGEPSAPHYSPPAAYAVVGQSVTVDEAPLATLAKEYSASIFQEGVAHLIKQRDLLGKLTISECVPLKDIETINIALSTQDSLLGYRVDEALNHALTTVQTNVNEAVLSVIGDTKAFIRFESDIKHNMFYRLALFTEPCQYTEAEGLVLYATDFFTHLYTGVDKLDDSPLSRLYVTLLERLSGYSGIWQSDAATLYQEAWYDYCPTLEPLLEKFKTLLYEKRNYEAAKSALGADKDKLDCLFLSLDEQVWMMCDSESVKLEDSYLEDIVSEIDHLTIIGKHSSKRQLLTQKATLSELIAAVDRSEPKADMLCEIAERISSFCGIEKSVCRLRDCMTLMGEGMEFLGFVLQEVYGDEGGAINEASQQTYEHLMNAAEADETLCIDIDDPNWKDALNRFAVAIASIVALTSLMTNG